MRRRARSLRGSGNGIAESSACVYGCAGRLKTRSTSPISTILPRYMTATRSAMYRTTDRSCATNRYDRSNSSLEFLQEIDDAGPDRHVQRGDRLIQHQQLRLQRQRPGNADALALSAGEFLRIAAGMLRAQPDSPQQFGDTPGAFGGRHAVRLHRLGKDVGDRHPRVERSQRVLKHHAHLPAHLEPFGRGHPGGVLAKHRNAAGSRPDQAEDFHDRRGFPAAGFADQAQRFALANVEADSVHRINRADPPLHDRPFDQRIVFHQIHEIEHSGTLPREEVRSAEASMACGAGKISALLRFFSSISSERWQAAKCASPDARIGTRSGSVRSQISTRIGQRGVNGQPGGKLNQ